MSNIRIKYKKGDIVRVDEDVRGGYLAKIVQDYGRFFVRIECDGQEWDLMKGRVRLNEESK